MKILLIHNRYQQPGGEDSVFQSETNLLREHGHEVRQMIYDNSVIKTFWDRIAYGLKTIYNSESARVLSVKIKEFKPAIIHVHNFLPIVSPSVLFTAKKFNVPVVLTLHNYRLICPSATLFFNGQIYERSIHSVLPLDAILRGVYRNSFFQTAAVALMTAIHNFMGTWKNKVDCYITLTRFAREKFQHSALSLPANKLVVKPNFTNDPGVDHLVRKDFFLFIGRLTEEKGIETLLEASKLHNFKLTIIGDGPLRDRVVAAADNNPNIRYLGFQSKSNVLYYLKKCRALIFPSVWYEGFPVTIVEAFSTATPVVASNLGSMKEIIKNGVNGLHFAPGNPNDLVLKIVRLNDEAGLAKKLSDHARSSYLTHYTPENNYRQLLRIYERAIGSQIKLSHVKKPSLQYQLE